MKVIFNLIFLSFRLVISCFHSAQSQDISTIGEIYDYEIGDIFHYQESTISWDYFEGTITYRNIEVLDKYFSTDGDTLHYEMNFHDTTYYVWDNTNVYQASNYTEIISYTNLDSLIRFGDIDTVYIDPDLFNGRDINFKDTGDIADTITNDLTYIVGCGGPYLLQVWDHPTMGAMVHKKELVYFKKGTEQWGEPVYVGTDSDIQDDVSFSFFPIPFQNFINYQYKGNKVYTGAQAIFCDINGSIMKQILLDNSGCIDLSEFDPGVYIILVRTNIGIFREKLIKM